MGNLILKGNQKNRQELLVSMKEIYKKTADEREQRIKDGSNYCEKELPQLDKRQVN